MSRRGTQPSRGSGQLPSPGSALHSGFAAALLSPYTRRVRSAVHFSQRLRRARRRHHATAFQHDGRRYLPHLQLASIKGSQRSTAGVLRNENRSVGPVRRRAAGGRRAFDGCVHIATVKERQAPVEVSRGGRGAGWSRQPAEGGIIGKVGEQTVSVGYAEIYGPRTSRESLSCR